MRGADGAAAGAAALTAGSIPRPPSKPLYLVALWAVTVLCALIPLLYLGLIGGIAWLEWVVYTRWLPLSEEQPISLHLMAWILPGFVGLVLLLFLVKPLLAPRTRAPDTLRLAPDEQPELVRTVHALCAAIGTRPPVAIELTHEANAWVRFDDGLRGWLGGRKTLTIGLPLAAGMSTRQFTGVLAHEFGHFAQGGGMRSATIINSVNGWLWSRGYQHDAWDDRLEDWGESGGLPVVAAMASLWLVRKLMRGLFQLSFRLSQRLSQEMEFDADRYEAIVAGSAAFRDSSLRMRALGHAMHQARLRNRKAWREGKLVADLPAAGVAVMEQWEARDWERVSLELQGNHETRYWDTHPADQERIANAEAIAAPGLVLDDTPAVQLFRDFPALGRRVTEHYYRGMDLGFGPRNLIDVDQLLGLNRIDKALTASWNRYTNGMLGELPLLSPKTADLPPLAALDWQACVDELRRLAPDATGLWQRLARLREGRISMAPWIVLIDLGIEFTGSDGGPPDFAQLRARHAAGALQRDTPDHRLAERILALFARRLQHAARALPEPQAATMQQGLAMLQTLHDAAPRLLALDEDRQAVLRLQADIAPDVLPAEQDRLRQWVRERAGKYRSDLLALLEALDAVELAGIAPGGSAPEPGESLGKHLRNRCGHWSSAADDALRFLRVTAPLLDAYLHVYRSTLAALAAEADRAESAYGIQPLRLVEPGRKAATAA